MPKQPTALDHKNDVAKPPVQQNHEPSQTAVPPFTALHRVHANPSDITPNDAKILQRTIGNQALSRLTIQRKMTLGPVGDKYEQEADAVAKQVISNLQSPNVQSSSSKTAQRQEEEEMQMKPLVQRQEEEEMQMKPLPTITSLQRQEDEDLQAKLLPTISTVQRQDEEEDVQMKPFRPILPHLPFLQRQDEEEAVQAKGDPMLGGGELSQDIESSVQSAKSGGRPLDNTIRQPMENAFNADFSGVKVHTGSQSDTINRSISARAFTTGSDIFFRGGEYNPNSSSGQTLLAHELTHVVQQGGAPSTTGVQRQTTNNTIQRWGIKNWFKKKSKKKTDESTTTEPTVENTTETEEQEVPVDLQLNDAVEYERNLGKYAFGHSKAGGAAIAMINKMSTAMLKDFDKEDEEHRKKLTALYGKDSINSAGQVGTEFNAVWGAINEGNLREKLTALYNAMYGPFKTYLTKAMKDKSWSEMEEKGLNTTKLKRRKRQMRFNLGAKDLYRDPGNPLDRKKFKSFKHVGNTRFKKDETSDRTVGDLEQGKHSTGLSDREKNYQFGQEQEESDNISGKKLKWKEGGSYWGVNKKNKWVKKIENSMHMPVVAGPSGSMLRMFQLWEFLNKPIDAAQWRLAVLGWMLSANDHSFHEMMMTAADYGLPYKPGHLSYMNVSPLSVWELRDNVAKDSLFPHELAFKRKTDSGGFHMLEQEDLEDATEDLADLDKDEKGAVSAPAAAMIKLYSEFGYLLLNPTKEGGMLLKKKVENAINNKAELKHIKKGIEDGEYTVDNLIAETKEMMPMMESALDMIPDWSGNLFRGEGTFNPWSYRAGSTFSFGKFGSSTTDETVAKDFADNYNKGPYKYVLKMNVTAGKDIRKFASYAEDEILLPPGSKFKVKEKNKVGKYTYVDMDQIGRGGNKLELGEHDEVEEDPLTLGPMLTYYGSKGDDEPYGVFIDEFDANYINIDHEDGEWTEFNYLKEGTFYWAKTSELDAFMHPEKVNVLDDSPVLSEKAQLLTPDLNKPITFSSMGGIEYESIDQPTNIEVLDDLYPDGLDGWENVQVKNLDSGQIGFINYIDLKKYLPSKTKVVDKVDEAEESVGNDKNFGLPSSISFDIISMFQAGGDIEMVTSMGMIDDSIFKSLTDKQILALAKLIGISKEDVEEQISNLP